MFPEKLTLWQEQRREKEQAKKAQEEDAMQDAFDAAFADADFTNGGGEPDEGSETGRSMDDMDSILQLEDLVHVEYCSDSAVAV